MTVAVAAPFSDPAPGHVPIRVMVVDDAVVVRGMIARWIEAETDLKIVASLRSGREAIEQMERTNPDVLILDVDMPDIDGITALPLLFEKKRNLVVLMASTLTRRNAEISLRALSLGAADYIPKPETNREFTTSTSFRRELIDKVRALALRYRRGTPGALLSPSAPAAAPATALRRRADPSLLRGGAAPPLAAAAAPAAAEPARIQLRSFPPVVPRVLLIGASTGGPQALTAIVGSIGAVVERAPVLITQHMPATFTAILAEHLTRASGCTAREAEHGEPVLAGRIYVAPGGRHLRVVRQSGEPAIALDDGPLINFCKPAVDPLFSSAAAVWKGSSLALVLTGMGSDGKRGAAEIVTAGGCVIVQDEASSVVWGMPGSVAHAGLASAVLPLDQIAPRIVRLLSGGRP
jgi:two-component system, chemotaxis family, protein-glutamate methylesterase/glutaminase